MLGAVTLSVVATALAENWFVATVCSKGSSWYPETTTLYIGKPCTALVPDPSGREYAYRSVKENEVQIFSSFDDCDDDDSPIRSVKLSSSQCTDLFPDSPGKLGVVIRNQNCYPASCIVLDLCSKYTNQLTCQAEHSALDDVTCGWDFASSTCRNSCYLVSQDECGSTSGCSPHGSKCVVENPGTGGRKSIRLSTELIVAIVLLSVFFAIAIAICVGVCVVFASRRIRSRTPYHFDGSRSGTLVPDEDDAIKEAA